MGVAGLDRDNNSQYSVIMIRTQVSFDAELYREARREARRLGISFAEFCRRAIVAAMGRVPRKGKRPWMRYSGAIASGDPNASRSIDEVVYGGRR